MTLRELFSPSVHVHPRIGSHGRTILVDGPAVQADEEEPSDLEGQRVIWDLALFEEMLGRLPCACGGSLRLARSEDGKLEDKQQGLAHEFSVACTRCGKILTSAPTSRKLPSEGPGRPVMEINRAACAAGEMTGVRRAKQTRLLNLMGVDGVQKDSTYAAHAAVVHAALEQLSEDQLVANRVKVRNYLIDNGAEPDEHMRVGCVVSADGSWPVRGYSSTSGQGALIFEDGDDFPPVIIAQACRGRVCRKCDWYAEHQPTYVVPPHVCAKNWWGSSKAMEADILCHLVEEVGTYEFGVDDENGGGTVPVPEEQRLHIDAVCCDEDSSFAVRLGDGSILKQAGVPVKLSDLNHSRNILYKRLTVLRAAKFCGTTVLNAKVCDCLSKNYGWCIKQNHNNPGRAKLQVLNMIDHYFGDHSGCRDYEIKDEDGNMVTWCGFHRVGPHYKFKQLKNGKALDPVFKKKIEKVRGQPAPDPPYEEIQFKEEILKLFQPFIEQNFLKQVTSGKNTNPNESFHSKASSQMGGKHTCKTQGGFYVGAMRAATLRYSIGESYSESVLDAVGVGVCETTRERNLQANAKSASRKLYYKKQATKRLHGKRVAKRKKQVWRERNTEEEGYGKGMAMSESGDDDGGGGDSGDGGELKTEDDEDRRERARDAARARGDDVDEDMEDVNDDGAHGDDSSGDDEEPPEVVECLLCRGQEIAHDDYMLICCDQRCLQAAHAPARATPTTIPRATCGRNPPS